MTPEDRAKLTEIICVAEGRGTILETRLCSGLSAWHVSQLTRIPRERLEAIEASGACDPQELALLLRLLGVPSFLGAPPENPLTAEQCSTCFAVWTSEGEPASIPHGPHHTPKCQFSPRPP